MVCNCPFCGGLLLEGDVVVGFVGGDVAVGFRGCCGGCGFVVDFDGFGVVRDARRWGVVLSRVVFGEVSPVFDEFVFRVYMDGSGDVPRRRGFGGVRGCFVRLVDMLLGCI